MKKISYSILFLLVFIASIRDLHAINDTNWDQQIEMCLSIEDPYIDFEIQSLFSSDQLTRKLLCYELDGCFYKVLLIHNPDKLNLESVIEFNTEKHGRVSCTLNHNVKVGIFFDKEAPKALVDHISNLHSLSWWESLWELVVSNGSKPEVQISWFDGTYINYHYYNAPYSNYVYMMKASPKE